MPDIELILHPFFLSLDNFVCILQLLHVFFQGQMSFDPSLDDGRAAISSGVERELQHAHEAAKDVYVIWTAKQSPSVFVTQTATKVFSHVAEALDFFQNIPRVKRILTTLYDVGLEYIKLGQSATTLSGGEAQRVKLAKELSRVATGNTVYILDEPTTGLHFADIQKLLDVLHRLTDAGNSVIVIEHNLDVIRSADWIVDLGPEGGDEGGQVIAEGTPEEVARLEGSYTGLFLRQVLA